MSPCRYEGIVQKLKWNVPLRADDGKGPPPYAPSRQHQQKREDGNADSDNGSEDTDSASGEADDGSGDGEDNGNGEPEKSKRPSVLDTQVLS